MSEITEVLERFKLTSLRPSQKEVIDAVLSGADTLAVMPTGAGKSLCYQLPALLLDGVTVVVSPLISLMKDQVDSMRALGIPAIDVTSQSDDVRGRLDQIARGEVKLVYVAPERFRSQRFVDALKQAKIALFAIDEAHCVSQWGHDFRPDYLRLEPMLQLLQPQRRVALTATATPEVRVDIERALGLTNTKVIVRGFDRPNLFFAVESIALKQKAERIAAIVRGQEEDEAGSVIVYAGTRKNAEQLGEDLKKEGLRAGVYHAGLQDERRKDVQDKFMDDAYDVLVATNAFGMGVDKPDVRHVIHADLPRSLEAYYQEAGRAGRDGEPARCTLLFNGGDIRLQEYFIDSSHPPATLLRGVWKSLRDEPALGSDLETLEARVQAKNTMQLEAAVRQLVSAGLIVETSAGLEATRPAPDAPPFDAEGPTKRAAVETQKLSRMTAYAYSHRCRRFEILSYFGDEDARGKSKCDACDNCVDRPARQIDATERERVLSVLRLIDRTDGRYGRAKLVQVLIGEQNEELERRGLHRLHEFGALAHTDKSIVFEVIAAAEATGLVQTESGEYPTLSLTEEGLATLRNPNTLQELVVVQPRAVGKKKKATKSAGDGPLDSGLVDKLRVLRTEIAREEQRPPFMIWSNKTLDAIARHRPKSYDALLRVPGMGEHKAQTFGNRILAITRDT